MLVFQNNGKCSGAMNINISLRLKAQLVIAETELFSVPVTRVDDGYTQVLIVVNLNCDSLQYVGLSIMFIASTTVDK